MSGGPADSAAPVREVARVLAIVVGVVGVLVLVAWSHLQAKRDCELRGGHFTPTTRLACISDDGRILE